MYVLNHILNFKSLKISFIFFPFIFSLFLATSKAHQCAALCQEKNDKFDWTRNKGGTPSFSTGPSADHTTGNGKN